MLFKNKVEVFVLESFEIQEVHDADRGSQKETEYFNMLEIWLSTLEMEQSLLVPKLVSVYFSSIVLKHPFLFS